MSTDEKLLRYLKRVTTELHHLREQKLKATDEPVAILGMGCRLPGGATTPAEFWAMVRDGRDGITPFPTDRGWDLDRLFNPDPDHPGTSYAREGGFLADAPGFDAGFFGISPREALAMDPQQRLLLECSWEALEDAGLNPDPLKGAEVGVFCGVSGQGYGVGADVSSDLEGYMGTGLAGSVASGRVSYVFGFEGPAVTVDTACSSSLVAMHLAAQALRQGECSMALAGGAAVMATPDGFIDFSRQRALAADGRCKSFAAAADGTGWGEAVGMLLLERLSDAQRLGHRVLAVVRGSAVNQDGASNGLTAPNGPSQQRVIRRALAASGLSGADVDAVEAHGTGTVLGDPIEAQALLATYGRDRDAAAPLWLGSVKSNIGHAQAGAGVAAVIKMVQALRYGVLPATLHVDEPTPEVDWSSGTVRLLTEARPWPRNGRPRRAGISSFGMSGTNAHLILEEAPSEPQEAAGTDIGPDDLAVADPASASDTDAGFAGGVVPLVVSGRGGAGLAGQAGRLAEFVGSGAAGLAAVAGGLAAGRAVLPDRAVVIAESSGEAVAGLSAVVRGEHASTVVAPADDATAASGAVVFVFPGQGAQWVGMGQELLARSPVFAREIDRCAEALAPWVEWSLHEVLTAGGDVGAGWLARVDVVQPASFAVMVALAGLWRSLGVAPDAVTGHSQGEIAAAYVSGALSLEDAARVVAVRSRVIASELAGRGAMASVALSEAEVRARLDANMWSGVEVAAVNGPMAVVVAGPADDVRALVEDWSGEGIRVRLVPVDYASHTAAVDAIGEPLLEGLGGLRAQAPQIPFYSTARGEWVRDDGVLDAGYWFANLRGRVGFEPAVRELLADGHMVFVEVGAHPVLVQSITEIADQDAPAAVVVGSLRRDEPEVRRLLTSAAELFVHGISIDWTQAVPATDANHFVDLPTYAFQHHHYWLSKGSGAGNVNALGLAKADHPLLGALVELPHAGGVVFTSRIGLSSHGWLADHAVGGVVLVPGAGLVELAIRAGDQVGAPVLEELIVEAPLVIPQRGGLRLRVEVGGPDGQGRRTVSVYSGPDEEPTTGGPGPEADEWQCHATGVLCRQAPEQGNPRFDLGEWPPAGAEPVDVDDFYPDLVEQGYEYGPVFQGLRAVWRRRGEVFAEIALAEEQWDDAGRYGIHPALLDAAQHTGFLAAALAETGGEDKVSAVGLPFAWNGVELHAAGATALRVRMTAAVQGGMALESTDDSGEPVLSMESLVSRPVSTDQLETASVRPDGESLYRVEWIESAAPADPADAAVWATVSTTEQMSRLADEVATGRALPEWIVVPAMDDPCSADETPDDEAVHRLTVDVLEVLQAWLAESGLEDSRLAVVTRGAVPAGSVNTLVDVAGSAVWGLVRAAQAENPERLVLIDVDPNAGVTFDGDDTGLRAGMGAVAVGEWQVAVRGDVVWVPRLVRAGRGLEVPGDGAWSLVAGEDRSLDGIDLLSGPEKSEELSEGLVRVGLRALGVNFRDVLVALGMYPGGGVMGAEGAGVVLEVGPGVSELEVGDHVMGLTGMGFGSETVTDHRYLVRIPCGWSFEIAASVPVAFLTAFYGLCDLGGLRSGQRVLVHAASGGVGMAATQLARSLGAEVFGTASPGKWPVLWGRGFDRSHVFSSRDASFERGVLEATTGTGVNVVLDCLAGELVDASLRLLVSDGRFVEMGKTDVRDPEWVANEFPGVAYQAFDLMEAGPERIAEMLSRLVELFEAGVLEPLPRMVWDVRRAREAFRFMSQARHTGKIVLAIPRGFDAGGVVVVAGGTGSLGGLVAQHLVVEHGVRHLVLASRRGARAEGVSELVARLEASGASVSVSVCDITDRDEVRRLLSDLPAGRRLSGVVHTAGVLDDGVLGELDAYRVAKVFAPKVQAVAHLDALTRELHPDLDVFAVFSSASGVFGSAGQGNYAAANAFLDAAMVRRRAAGFPGLSLAWGLWQQQTGMTGHLTELDHARMSRFGFLPLPEDEGLALLDAGLDSGHAAVVPSKLDLRAMRTAGEGMVPPLLRTLVRPMRRVVQAQVSPGAQDGGLAERLAGLAVAEQERILLDLVRGHAATVLGHQDGDEIAADRAFKDAGFDSLTAVELRNRLREGTGVRLAATAIFDYPTPLVLARHLREELVGHDESLAVSAPVATVAVDEPIAIVGMSCRMPGGVMSPADLWELVRSGRDGIGPFPTDRGWDLDRLFDPDPSHPGTSYGREGGFLQGAAEFDAGFFGISPREALAMDPQHRLLLECSWEALEDAGIAPDSLRGTEVGVFSGVSGQGYSASLGALPEDLEGYLITGLATSVASGRVSYVFGFEGPAVSVDTACSSSLVAMHLAVQALRQGECSMALAGGATVMASPGTFIEFSRQRGLAADGRCKSFAASADGTSFSEGVGLVVLERLSVARRLGHRVLAVVRGSAVNQDGASNGLTAPNGPSQQRVIRRALAAAGLSADDVDAVEAHGTGTVLGDPIEAQALQATYGRDRSADAPLWFGSIKSNIGHTQGAAGVAGALKMVQALRYGELPPTLHVDEPTPQVDWSSGTVQLLTEARPWPRNGRPRRAGISAFGISGTNAHLILEEAPEDLPRVSEGGPASESVEAGFAGGVVPLVVSGRSGAGLAGQAGRLADFLGSGADVELSAVAGVLVAGRAVLSDRAVVVAGSSVEAVAGLSAVVRGEHVPGAVMLASHGVGSVVGSSVVWVFPGQGAQWVGMGRELLACSAVFAREVDRCAEALAPWVDWSLREVLMAEGDVGAGWLARVDVVQPVSFAVMVALAGVWRSLGVVPDVVVGHSQGEIVAAYVSGALSLADAARVVAVRSRVIAEGLAGRGAMASVALSEAEVRARLSAGVWSGVEVAVVNGPAAVVVAGSSEDVRGLVEEWSGVGVRARLVPVDYASHSAAVDVIRERLLEGLAGVEARAPQVGFFSTALGEWVRDGGVLGAEYWFANLRGRVGFEPVVRELLAQGHGVFIEVSAHPVLVQSVTEIADRDAPGALVVGSLRRDEPEVRRLLTSAAELFVHGVPIDWAQAVPAAAGHVVELPTYAFQHRHYWLRESPGSGDATSLGLAGADHPLLGAVVDVPETGGALFTSRLSRTTHPWLVDHAVRGVVVLPTAGLVELTIRAGDHVGVPVLDELTVEAPLVVPEHGALRLQLALGGPDEQGRRPVTVYSASDSGAADAEPATWRRHATGTLSDRTSAPGAVVEFEAWPPAGGESLDVGALDARLAERGLEYGPVFQAVTAAWRRGDELFAEAVLDEKQWTDGGRFGLHPALIDAALRMSVPTEPPTNGDPESVWLPSTVRGVVLHVAGASSLRMRLVPDGSGAWSVSAADDGGVPVLTVDSVASHPVEAERFGAAAGSSSDRALFRVDWAELPDVIVRPAKDWALSADAGQIRKLAEHAAAGDAPPSWVVLSTVSEAGHTVDAMTTLELTGNVLTVVQAWLAEPALVGSRLVVVTRGAVAASAEAPTDIAGAAVWGLVRAAQAENPERIVLLDTESDPAAGFAALDDVVAAGEWQVAVRGNSFYTPRLARADIASEATDADSGVFDPEGVVVVTGGTGSLGALVVRHLVAEHGVRHLTLVSRRGLRAEGADDLAARLEASGVSVSIVACDVADRDAVRRLLSELPDGRRLTGVVHTAGVLDDGVLGQLTADRLAVVFGPKVDAVSHLDALTRELYPDLDVFAVFSSAAGVFGSAGQANYAAANAFLDAVAQRRRADGLSGLSLAWGLWRQDTGMTGHLTDVDHARIGRNGVLPLSPEDGLALFDAALRGGQAFAVPIRLNLGLARANALAEGGMVPALLRGLIRPMRRQAYARAVSGSNGGLAARLAGLSIAEQEQAVLDLVRSRAATVLGHVGGDSIEADRAFKDAGFDSLTAVELRNRLRESTGVLLPSTAVFDHPTPLVLARHLRGILVDGEGVNEEITPSQLALQQIDRLEEILTAGVADGVERLGITTRLQELLAAWTQGAEEVTEPDAEPEIDSASDEEIFDIIGREFGIS